VPQLSAVPNQEFFGILKRLGSAKAECSRVLLIPEKKKILRDAFFIALNG
jgi:hypothetical protein